MTEDVPGSYDELLKRTFDRINFLEGRVIAQGNALRVLLYAYVKILPLPLDAFDAAVDIWGA